MTENFGAFLKHERELRGVPLEEISGATRIHMRYLVAMEENQFEELPGEVFVKGYIRAYARIIGSNAEEMINTYDHSVGRSRIELQQQNEIEKEKKRTTLKNRFGYSLLALILIVMVGGGTYLFLNQHAPEPQMTTAPSALEKENKPAEETESPVAKKEESPAGKIRDEESKQDESKSDAAETPRAETKNEKKTASESDPPRPQKVESAEPPELKQTPVFEPVLETAAGASANPGGPNIAPEEDLPATDSAKKPSQSSEKEVIIQTVPVNVDEKKNTTDNAPPGQSDLTQLTLKIQVQGISWFNMSVDDFREEDFILPGGTTKSFIAQEKFLITIGNKEDTELFLNDHLLELPESTDKVVRNFLITSNLLAE